MFSRHLRDDSGESAPVSPPGSVGGQKPCPLSRESLDRYQVALLNQGRWGNAVVRLCRCDGVQWVVKDFVECPLLVRDVWGARMVTRELRAFERLRGVEGVPQDACRIDRYALAYRFVDGRALCDVPREQTDGAFFEELEKLVREFHSRKLVHLDLRYRRNILVDDNGRPCVLDFQSHVCLDRKPALLRHWLMQADLAGIYKHWCKRSPETMGADRLMSLWKLNRLRRLWRLKGYGFQVTRKRVQRYEDYVCAVREKGGLDVDESAVSVSQ